MKKSVKSIFAALSCAAVIACACSITACGASCPEYYNKTITVTGAALPIGWDVKGVRDGVTNSTGNDSTLYSCNQLLKRYWEEIDFDYASNHIGSGISPFGDGNFASPKEFMNKIDADLPTIFAAYQGYKLVFGSEEEKTCTFYTHTRTFKLKLVETQEEFEAIKPQIDPRCTLVNIDAFPYSRPGHDAYGFADTDSDGLYDSYADIHTMAFTVNKNKNTLVLDMNVKSGATQELIQYDLISLQADELVNYGVWTKPREVNASVHPVYIFSLPIYPEITFTENE